MSNSRLALALFLLAVCARAGEVERLAVELDRAEKKAAYSEWLYTEGVLAKSEAEQTKLLVFRLKNDLAAARLEEAQKTGKDEAAAKEAADAASREWKRAELDAALLNLKRQRTLYAKGVVPRSDVRRAEEAVAALQAK